MRRHRRSSIRKPFPNVRVDKCDSMGRRFGNAVGKPKRKWQSALDRKWGQAVIGINHPFAFLNQHAVLLLRDRHQIPFLDLKSVEDLAWDNDLPATSYAGDLFFSCGCFSGHDFRSVWNVVALSV